MINNERPKKRHIAVKIFAIIALAGLALTIVGFALGGRVGTFYERDGRFVYQTAKTTYDIGAAPYWAQNRYFSVGQRSLFSLGSDRSWMANYYNYDYDYDYDYEYEYEYDYGDYGYDTHNHSYSYDSSRHGHGDLAGAAHYDGSTRRVANDTILLGNDLDYVELDFTCGYVLVQPGDTAALTVDGPLEAELYVKDGVLNIETKGNGKSVSSKLVDGLTHFYRDGVDVTTYYTLTLPKGMDSIEAELGVGSMLISDFVLDYLDVSAAAGEVTVNNVMATYGDFDCQAGAILVDGFEGESVDLEAQAGAIEFTGLVEYYLSAEVQAGAIKITLPRPEEYGYIIDNSFGAVSLDGKTYAGFTSHSSTTGNSSNPFFTLNLVTEAGAIEVNFT